MAKTYNFAQENINRESSIKNSIPESLKPSNNLSDDLFHSVGLYSKKEIDEARFKKYSRYGRLLDPNGKLNDCREYLFFVKPDLHIVIPEGSSKSSDIYRITGHESTNDFTYNGLTLNPQLGGNLYFKDLISTHPDVIRDLQLSAPGNTKDVFSHLLSSSVSGYLDLPSSEATTLDNPSTIFGATYDYLGNAENSDENPTFSLEFVDNRYLDTYNFFKGFAEYHIARKTGLVTPPKYDYYINKRLHNTMGIYKFIVAEDMETIIYYAYFWGVYPVSYPREAFSDPLFSDGLTFSVNFKSAFMEDMNPSILYQFNKLMRPLVRDTNKWIKVVKEVDDNPGSFSTPNGIMTRSDNFKFAGSSMIDGTLPSAALITGNDTYGIDGTRTKYRIRWYE